MSELVDISESRKRPEITETKLQRIVDGVFNPRPEFVREMAKRLLKLDYNVEFMEDQ